jgi:hypothetical protein
MESFVSETWFVLRHSVHGPSYMHTHARVPHIRTRTKHTHTHHHHHQKWIDSAIYIHTYIHTYKGRKVRSFLSMNWCGVAIISQDKQFTCSLRADRRQLDPPKKVIMLLTVWSHKFVQIIYTFVVHTPHRTHFALITKASRLMLFVVRIVGKINTFCGQTAELCWF